MCAICVRRAQTVGVYYERREKYNSLDALVYLAESCEQSFILHIIKPYVAFINSVADAVCHFYGAIYFGSTPTNTTLLVGALQNIINFRIIFYLQTMILFINWLLKINQVWTLLTYNQLSIW